MSKDEDFVVVGRLGKPHGLKGEIELYVLTDFPDRFQPGANFFIRPPLPENNEIKIDAVRKKQPKLIIKINGIDDRLRAESLKGRELVIPQSETVLLPEDAYWHYQLIGLKVITVDGRELGIINEIISSVANDIYVVGNGTEYLIPATGEVIKEINLADKEMIINPLPGLLD